MALKRNPDNENELVEESSISGQKAKQLFSNEVRKPKKEKKNPYNLFHRAIIQKRIGRPLLQYGAGVGRRNSVFSQGILKKTW